MPRDSSYDVVDYCCVIMQGQRTLASFLRNDQHAYRTCRPGGNEKADITVKCLNLISVVVTEGTR